FIRYVSYYTNLGVFRLSWLPSSCLNEPTPFVDLGERALWHIYHPSGSSRIVSPFYHCCPSPLSLQF
ncbi:unnamed protein product, partial [Discosporangium mesarthrocarpum]